MVATICYSRPDSKVAHGGKGIGEYCEWLKKENEKKLAHKMYLFLSTFQNAL